MKGSNPPQFYHNSSHALMGTWVHKWATLIQRTNKVITGKSM